MPNTLTKQGRAFIDEMKERSKHNGPMASAGLLPASTEITARAVSLIEGLISEVEVLREQQASPVAKAERSLVKAAMAYYRRLRYHPAGKHSNNAGLLKACERLNEVGG